MGFHLTDQAQRELALVRAHRAELLRSASPEALRALVGHTDALARLADSIGDLPE